MPPGPPGPPLPAPVREDLADGIPGPPLHLLVHVLGPAGRPLDGARVDVWHADAQGRYSQPPQTYGRGAGVAGRDGTVRFRTVMPGAYGPNNRHPHLHLAIQPPGEGAVNTQVNLPGAPGEEGRGPGLRYALRQDPDDPRIPRLEVWVTPSELRGAPGGPPVPPPGGPPVPPPPAPPGQEPPGPGSNPGG